MPGAFFSLDSRLRDFFFLIRKEIPISHNVVLVDIDEKSLQKYGQWPWNRELVSQLLYKLSDAGSGIIGLDIVFAEEDKSSPHKFAPYLPEAKNLPNYDQILADTFMQTPVIGGYIFSFERTGQEETPIIPAIFVKKGFVGDDRILKPQGIVLNTPILQNALYSSGFFNNTPDESGMIRYVPLVMEYDDVIYPSLALEMIRIYKQQQRVDVIGDESGVREIELGELQIPTDLSGRMVVNFRGAGKTFPYISAADILEGNFNPKDLEGKFVLVGTSALGLSDLRSIPYDSAIAGVEVHANVIDNILKGDFLRKPSEVILYDIMMIWSIVFVVMLLLSISRSRWLLPITISVIYLIAQVLFNIMFDYGYVLNLLFPFLAIILTFASSVGYDYFIESNQKEITRRILGKKVSPAVMEYLLKHSNEKLVESKELEVTIFFSDIRSFTSISEEIGSPDKLIHMLNRYMTPMVENIVSHEGTIDKFIGDAIMAYWNAPLEVKNHADKAVLSAIEQIALLESINSVVTPQYGVSINIGIGIHTGIVTAGDMGSEGRSDYTIIGDNVNLASRMEGLTKQYGTQILISHETYKRLQGDYQIRSVDLVAVKGKNEAVEIFEVIPAQRELEQEELDLYQEAIEAYRAAELQNAYEKFVTLQERNGSKLYEQYIQRCRYYLDNEDIPFSAVLKMTTK